MPLAELEQCAVLDARPAHVVNRLTSCPTSWRFSVGGSTGDWNTASFGDSAGDVVAAVGHVCRRA